MKHSDDDINEWLGSALKKRLTGTGDQPDPQLAGKILNAAGGRPHVGWWAGALILLICGVLSITPLADQKLTFDRSLVRKSPDLKSGRRNENLALHGSKQVGLENSASKVRYTGSFRNPSRTRKLELADVHPAPLGAKANAGITEAGNQTRFAEENKTVGGVGDATPDPIELSGSGPTAIRSLDMLTPHNVTFPMLPSTAHEILAHNGHEVKPLDGHRPWNILFGVTPMNTFQLVHIKPNQPETYQNFSFAPVLSARKMAYKVHMGVEQSGWQLQATYNHFKQAFHYEIATDEYVINPTYSSQELIRKGVGMEENQTFNMIGIGLSKSILLGGHHSHGFVARVGLEYSHDFHARQSMAWGMLMIGRDIHLNGKTSLTLGPQLTYGLTKLNAAYGRFDVQPYQVGISMIFNLSSTKKGGYNTFLAK